MKDMTEKQLDIHEIYDGKILHVFYDDVLLPNGNTAIREYIRHIGAACVVPLRDDGRVLMLRQFRYPFKDVLLEIPAGKLDSKSEDPLEAAKRELKEETGASAAEWTDLGPFFPTCAYSDEVIHTYLARGLSFGEMHPDDDEFVEPVTIALDELIDMVTAGKIPDGKTQAALMKAYLYLQREKGRN